MFMDKQNKQRALFIQKSLYLHFKLWIRKVEAVHLWLQIDRLQELKGSEFLLDGYLTLGEPKEITIGGSTYSLQYFQGEHED